MVGVSLHESVYAFWSMNEPLTVCPATAGKTHCADAFLGLCVREFNFDRCHHIASVSADRSQMRLEFVFNCRLSGCCIRSNVWLVAKLAHRAHWSARSRIFCQCNLRFSCDRLVALRRSRWRFYA